MKNCEIDWDLAPEWAIAHALFAFGGEISEVWVGEDKWQRLTQDKSFPYGGGGGDAYHNPTRKQFKYETPRPKWVEGELPPVGTVCECRCSATNDKWLEVEVLVHFKAAVDVAVFVPMHGRRESSQAVSACFRPIRTPEQIAAEEREAKAKAMYMSIYFAADRDQWEHVPEATRQTFRLAIDAGWQQVKP